MRAPFILLSVIAALMVSTAASAGDYVHGYYRKNGTYVQPYYRSNPDGNPYNNYSTYGNVNPYTGQVGTHHVESYSGGAQPYSAPYQAPYSQPNPSGTAGGDEALLVASKAIAPGLEGVQNALAAHMQALKQAAAYNALAKVYGNNVAQGAIADPEAFKAASASALQQQQGQYYGSEAAKNNAGLPFIAPQAPGNVGTPAPAASPEQPFQRYDEWKASHGN